MKIDIPSYSLALFVSRYYNPQAYICKLSFNTCCLSRTSKTHKQVSSNLPRQNFRTY